MLQNLWAIINKYDKISHFIGGFILGVCGMELQPAFGLFVVKECFDTVKKNPTGFDNMDVVAGIGGWCAGSYVRRLLKL